MLYSEVYVFLTGWTRYGKSSWKRASCGSSWASANSKAPFPKSLHFATATRQQVLLSCLIYNPGNHHITRAVHLVETPHTRIDGIERGCNLIDKWLCRVWQDLPRGWEDQLQAPCYLGRRYTFLCLFTDSSKTTDELLSRPQSDSPSAYEGCLERVFLRLFEHREFSMCPSAKSGRLQVTF